MVQENNMKIIYITLLALLISGCSLKQEGLQFNNYGIDFNLPTTTYSTQASTIFIKEPNINSSFSSKQIIYSLRPYSFEMYAKNQWIDYPSSMLQQKLHDAIAQSHLYEYTLLKTHKTTPEYTLQTHIGQLFHDFQQENSYAVLNIKFELFDAQGLKKGWSYQKRVLCETNDAYGFVQAINQAFKEVCEDLTSQLHKTTTS